MRTTANYDGTTSNISDNHSSDDGDVENHVEMAVPTTNVDDITSDNEYIPTISNNDFAKSGVASVSEGMRLVDNNENESMPNSSSDNIITNQPTVKALIGNTENYSGSKGSHLKWITLNSFQAIRVFERYAEIFSLAKQRVNFLQKEPERRNICTNFGDLKRDIQLLIRTHTLTQSSIEPRAIHSGY
jgi:hypothetical protein